MAAFRLAALTIAAVLGLAHGYAPTIKLAQNVPSAYPLSMTLEPKSDGTAAAATSSRRSFFSTAAVGALTVAIGGGSRPPVAYADDDIFQKKELKPLDSYLYTILRVREATQQETRLIKTGKFKDIQRANVKLAVRFMVNNYRLSDNIVAASSYLEGQKSIQAGNDGQKAVQNLFTILEYFDASGVENIKVGGDSMAGKEKLVLSGLEATQKSLDDFIAYFPKDVVDRVNSKIADENALNEKEFDSSLGNIINLK